MCKNRTKTLSVYETLEFISQAPFSRNLPEEALESDERKPAKEEAEVPTVEPGRGRHAMGPSRPPSAGPGHTPPGDRCTGMFSQTADQPSAPEVKGGGKGACFLSPSVLSRNVCVLANACTTFFFLRKVHPLQGSVAHLYVLQPAFPGDLRVTLSCWRKSLGLGRGVLWAR